MIVWNAVKDPKAQNWAIDKNSRRLKIATAEFGTRAIGRRLKTTPKPDTLAAVAGQGDYGFKANRQSSEPIDIVKHSDGPYAKHRRKKIGTIAGIRQPYKRKAHGRATLCGLLTSMEVSGKKSQYRAPVAPVQKRQHGRRRRGKQLDTRPVDTSPLVHWADQTHL